MVRLSRDALKLRLTEARRLRDAWKKCAAALKKQNKRLRTILREGVQSLNRGPELPQIILPTEPGGALFELPEERRGDPELPEEPAAEPQDQEFDEDEESSD
ncbi:unnamed protein product [Prorocentrum cordatum]|uniref:Uncharacterized protein n=1 Tax=Prorocentrum cordatum TaxID=2364126 RepID=A0ABN9RBQ2_9DINO|nr:unnamed protein product [Polarella glacialis]